MTDNNWEKQWIADMKSDDPEVYEPAWRKFAVSYWNLLEEDMEKSLLKRFKSVDDASKVASDAWKIGSAKRTTIEATTLDGVYHYVKVIGLNIIRKMPQPPIPFPEEDPDTYFAAPSSALYEDIEPYVRAMDMTFDNSNPEHQEIYAMAKADVLVHLAEYMKPAYEGQIMMAWAKAIKYMLAHPDLMKHREVSFELLYDLKPRHIGSILDEDPATISQTVMRMDKKFKAFLEQFLGND